MGKLQSKITIGSVTFVANSSSTWVCEKNWNILRYRRGRWNCEGSPLSHHWECKVWRYSPEEAYRANLLHQIDSVRKQADKRVGLIQRELEAIDKKD